jgi:hypothetical protein
VLRLTGRERGKLAGVVVRDAWRLWPTCVGVLEQALRLLRLLQPEPPPRADPTPPVAFHRGE